MMSKEKDPVKETLKFIEDHAFFKPSAKLEMEAYLAKKEKILMMSKEKDPVKETLKFIEDHAFFKPSAKLEMEAYLAKKEKESAAADSSKKNI